MPGARSDTASRWPHRRAAVAAVAAGLLAPCAALAQGMPQLDFSTPLTTSQVVWGVLIFALLYVLLSFWALPRVGEVLQQRSALIEADLDTARAAKQQADAAVAETNEAIGHARAQAQAAINQAVDHAKQDAVAQAAVLNERLDTQLQAAERQIAEAQASAMSALRDVARDTAATLVQKLTGAPADMRRVEAAVGAALAARQA